MGDRYYVNVKCPVCGVTDEAYYAPTCGFVDWACKCGHRIDLEAMTGISAEDASNADVIMTIANALGEGIES